VGNKASKVLSARTRLIARSGEVALAIERAPIQFRFVGVFEVGQSTFSFVPFYEMIEVVSRESDLHFLNPI
jgi:hypothetical protein